MRGRTAPGRRRGRRLLALLLAAVLIAAAAVGIVVLVGALRGHSKPVRPAHRSARPNVVFVLTDDLSMDLVRFMPHVQAMEQEGMTFSDYFVSDSLCCPSRASIFTGNFPHTTKIVENLGRYGGFDRFFERGEERQSFPMTLLRAGYDTGLMGKYLNGYLQRHDTPRGLPLTYVPPGFSEWDVGGRGYPEFDYKLNQNGTLHRYGHGTNDYLTDVLARKGVDFIDHAALSPGPFFLELSTFAPHAPYTPAPRDKNTFPGLRAPRPPNFDRLPTNAPGWLASRPPLDGLQQAQIDRSFKLRVEAVQAVDRLIGSVEHALTANGLARNTYIVFSSDNGLHTGEYRLMPGKMTAFDTDIHVPLVVVGPGVPAGRVNTAMTENVDLAKTFAAVGHTRMTGDGHSLLPLLSGSPPRHWRNAILVEHRGLPLARDDPDFQQPASGNPTTYRAMRTRTFLYVEYIDGEREFYDLLRDPFELHNLAGSLPGTEIAQLHHELVRLTHCHGTGCWAAGHLADPAPAVPAG